MIRIHDSLTGTKRELVPLVPGKIGMYVCGMTIYDYLHIGHARMLITFDIVSRYLRHRGYQLTYVRNITDIDDKIIRRAAENGESIEALTARFIQFMNEDCEQLGIVRPDHEPRVTQYLPQIIQMIATLIDKGYAYTTPSGDVMYSVARFPAYGRLSGQKLADLRAGERVEVDEEKRDPLDFVLWKHAKPGEPFWDSPFGRGRPGWHIECSAMSTALLGTHFDLHGGGMDLKFPHHDCEIAQSCAATGDRFAENWLHNGFVKVDDEKMGKSLGNFKTIREVLPKLRHPEVLRYFMLMSHYRGPVNYSVVQLEQADLALGRLYTALRDLPEADPLETQPTAQFHEALDDDFNTAEALAALQNLARDVNVARSAGKPRAAALGAELRRLGRVLGILTLPPEQWFHSVRTVLDKEPEALERPALEDTEIEALIAARAAARKAKNWAESDRIRDELAAAGVIIEDRPGGRTDWRRA